MASNYSFHTVSVLVVEWIMDGIRASRWVPPSQKGSLHCVTPLGISSQLCLGLFCAWNGCMQSSTMAKSYSHQHKKVDDWHAFPQPWKSKVLFATTDKSDHLNQTTPKSERFTQKSRGGQNHGIQLFMLKIGLDLASETCAILKILPYL